MPTSTGRPGLRRASRRSSPRRRSCAESVVEWLERNGRRAVLRARLLHPSPPAPAEPDRLSRPLRGGGGGAVRRMPDARGGGGAPPARCAGDGDPVAWACPATSGSVGRFAPPTTARSARWTTGWRPLFDYLERSGLVESTLVVLTSDHGEMGGDHWLLEKLGYWDESYHVPLIVVDPSARRRREPRHGGRGGHRVRRRVAHHLRVHRCRDPAAGGRLVARSLPAGRAAA